MSIPKLLVKELKGLKLHFLVILSINILILAYLRSRIQSPGGFLAITSIPLTILYVAIFIQGFHVVKKEFDSGTIYLLLQLPISLEEILFTKFLAVFIEGFVLGFLTSIISAILLSFYHLSLQLSQVLNLSITAGLIAFPVLTVFYPAFAVKTIARRSPGFLAFITAIVLIYIDHLIYSALEPLNAIRFTLAQYSGQGIFINVNLSLQVLVFYALIGTASLIGGIWAIKKFNSL